MRWTFRISGPPHLRISTVDQWLACQGRVHYYDLLKDRDVYIASVRGNNTANCRDSPCPNRSKTFPAPRIDPVTRQDRYLPTDQHYPVQAYTAADMSTIADLIAAQRQFSQDLTAALTSSMGNKSVIQRPATFKGAREDARRWLSYFTTWVSAQKSLNSSVTPPAPLPQKWIVAALSQFEGDAAQWATPYLSKISTHETASDKTLHPFPFNGGDWNEFLTAFKQRFQAADDGAEARRELERLHQGDSSVAHYASLFQQIADRTGYSDTDQQKRFYDNLHEEVKDALTLVTLVSQPQSIDELIKLAVKVDFRLRERKGEKKGKPSSRPPVASFTAPSPAATPARDPMAMDIDAGRLDRPGPNAKTIRMFLEQMTGRCFGCGSTAHVKRQGGHDHEVCDYCGRRGHRKTVCQDRFIGLPEGQGRRRRIAATHTDGPFSLFDDTQQSVASTSSSSVSDSSTLAELRKIIEEQGKLIKQHF